MPRILQYEGISLTSKAIRFMTWSSFSHTAYELDDGRVIEAWQEGGVRILPNYRHGHTPGTLIRAYVLPGIPPNRLAIAERFLHSQLGKKYHFQGAFRFLSRVDQQKFDPETFNIGEYKTDHWFCSELVFAALLHGGIKLLARIPPWRVSPGILSLSPFLKLDEVLTVPKEKA